MLLLRSLLFCLGQILSTILFTPIFIILSPIPFKIRYRMTTYWWATFNLWWLQITCNINYTIEGIENLPKEPCIVMSNHQSAWETIALQIIFVPQAWVLKRELLWIPIYGLGLASMKPIAINRSNATSALRKIIREGQKRLNDKIWVVIFPEGTRSMPNEQKKYQLGGALLAEKSQFPIVPIAHNAGYLYPPRRLIKQAGNITMRIGLPICTHDKKASDIMNEVKNWIESNVESLAKP